MNASKENEPSLADLELAIQHRIAQRTAGRIHALEVEVVADRIKIRGRAASFHRKQLASQAVLEEMNASDMAQNFQIDVEIAVMSADSVGATTWTAKHGRFADRSRAQWIRFTSSRRSL
jgi:hypothetical protein